MFMCSNLFFSLYLKENYTELGFVLCISSCASSRAWWWKNEPFVEWINARKLGVIM